MCIRDSFPFDRPLLDFAERLLELYHRLPELLDLLLIPIRFQVDTKYGMVMAWPDHEKSMKNW
jgi:hypothetical protein